MRASKTRDGDQRAGDADDHDRNGEAEEGEPHDDESGDDEDWRSLTTETILSRGAEPSASPGDGRLENPGRRAFVRAAATAAAGLGLPRLARAAPAIVTSESARPRVEWGVQVGDVAGGRALVWSRTDRPARMVVEWSVRESLADGRRVEGPAALEDTDFTARLDLTGLPAGQRIHYRLRFQDLADPRGWSQPLTGSFQTPSLGVSDVTLAWTADTVGQGWGISPEWGGLRLYEAMRQAAPDVFVHCGDTIYADGPLPAERTLDDGTIWRNLVTPAKAKVAETLADFRGNYVYNLVDEHVRRFAAEVSQVVLWDDHETRNDWYPGQLIEDPRYTTRSADLLAARAKRAFLEMVPIRAHPDESERIYRSFAWGRCLELFALDLRSYRGPNGANRQEHPGPAAALMGPAQLAWLKASLAASPATWKIVASDQPLGLLVPTATGTPALPGAGASSGTPGYEAVANGPGPALGRELEIAELLRFIRDQRIRNVVWITGDVHYAAAHRYDPARARFTEFDPFWEFVAGPAHAGTFGPNVLDDTFGPDVRFLGIPPGMKPNRPPSDGLQFFGTIRVQGRSQVATIRLHDLQGRALFSLELPPFP